MSVFKSIDSMLENSIEPSSNAIIPKFTTVEMSVQSFVNKLKSIDSMSDREVQDIIKRQYDMFLDYDLFLKDPDMRRTAQELFTNEKFLSNLAECVQELQLTEHQIICCNKLAYDYIAYHTMDTMNLDIERLLLDLSLRVNAKTVIPLSSIMGLESAKYVAMIAKSSFDEDLNISRLNRYLIRSGLEVKEQNIIDIYSKLFTNVSNLFVVTMLTLPDSDYTKLENYRYDEMSKAMIDILDNMTSIEIEKVLRNYGTTYVLRGKPPVRFSFQGLHQSYSRIIAVLEKLELDGVIIP